MGERKGQNKYYPPDFDYKVHNTLSGYHGQHPLRERARKLDKGILIIRFEMPYNIWCDGCNSHIGMGVRYNAEKSKIGMYYTTPIYKFRMRCHLCPMYFEIKTDPSNHDYVIIVGARRKEQRWDPTENGQIVPDDRDSQKKLALDAMYKIEHGVVDKTKLDALNASALLNLVDQRSTHKDDFLLNQLARKKLRDTKKVDAKKNIFDNAVKKRLSLSMNLLPEHEQDVRAAKLIKISAIKTYDEKMEEKKKRFLGGVLIPNLSSAAESAIGNMSDNNLASDALSISSFSEADASSSRESSVKRIQQIASFNLNKIRATAFDIKVNAKNYSKNKNIRNGKGDGVISNNGHIDSADPQTFSDSSNTMEILDTSLSDNLKAKTLIDSHDPSRSPNKKFSDNSHFNECSLSSSTDGLKDNVNNSEGNNGDSFKRNKVGICGGNDVGNVLAALSSQYESSASSISDDEFL